MERTGENDADETRASLYAQTSFFFGCPRVFDAFLLFSRFIAPHIFCYVFARGSTRRERRALSRGALGRRTNGTGSFISRPKAPEIYGDLWRSMDKKISIEEKILFSKLL